MTGPNGSLEFPTLPCGCPPTGVGEVLMVSGFRRICRCARIWRMTFVEDEKKPQTDAPASKFKRGDRVRAQFRHRTRLGVVTVAYETLTCPDRPPAYAVRLDKTEDDDKRVVRYNEDEIEAVPAEPKFKHGDRVRVRLGGIAYSGIVVSTYDTMNGRSGYNVRMNPGEASLSVMEDELEAVKEGSPQFKKDDRVRVKQDATTLSSGLAGTIVSTYTGPDGTQRCNVLIDRDAPNGPILSYTEDHLELVKETP